MFKLIGMTQAGIALAYAQAPTFQASAIPSWKALAAHSVLWANKARREITILESSESEPYASADAMLDDIRANRTLIVSTANSEHPIFNLYENTCFRIVHDYYGHYAAHSDFTWLGEIAACQSHADITPDDALPALFTECIGQAAYATYRNRGFDANFKQKVAFLEIV